MSGLHTGGELCTPVHHDTVAMVGSRNKASHIYNSQFIQCVTKYCYSYLLKGSLELPGCVMLLSIY